MKKNELIPYKHLLVTRSNKVYWYVGSDFDNTEQYYIKKEFLCMSSGIDLSNHDQFWKDDLLANRDGYWGRVFEEPRKYDIIFIFEIVGNYEWFEYYRTHRYINDGISAINKWFGKPVVKKVWERIDSVMEN